ncbi:hypothetical protein RFI_03393 [Reticulomyxa filosa]|uniref:Uncharacterized protein n=1 Tax=Reticulomyxa filosa TaxID=46433 RepID=X6P6J3_RETFI|nr:hypothetical protein RFI_03393 [Reticulomyxa filosa]|eukprot:ETO33709.1 hypothetical protein RFI_03393 [Reticulomyxa filosa]
MINSHDLPKEKCSLPTHVENFLIRNDQAAKGTTKKIKINILFLFFTRFLPLLARRVNSGSALHLTYSVRTATTLVLELRSGRLGQFKLNSQTDLEKLLDRTGSIGLVADEEPAEEEGEEEEVVPIVANIEEIQKDKVYLLAYGAEEGEGFEESDFHPDLDEVQDGREFSAEKEEREQEYSRPQQSQKFNPKRK